MNLYEMLGVDKNATNEELKKAYYAKSKQLHPDHGGNQDIFIKTKRAYEILTNEKLRKEYDETGKITENNPTLKAESVQVLCTEFDEILRKNIGKLHQIDIAEHLKNAINKRLCHQRSEHRKLITALKQIRIAKDKLKFKGGSDFLKGHLNLVLFDIKNKLRDNARWISKYKHALNIASEYSYQFDVSYSYSRYSNIATVNTSTTNSWANASS